MKIIRTPKKKPIHAAPAFTLMEVLIVLVIIGMISMIVATITPLSERDHACYEDTVEIMDRVEQALLGVPPTHLEGECPYLRYIADMGEFPELLGTADHPAGLWTHRLAALYGAEKNLPLWSYSGNRTRLFFGWHGPYIEAPTGLIRDGWGNPLLFERFDITDEGTETPNPEGRNLRFKSLGSDGSLEESEDTGSGYEADIERVILAKDYIGTLAGYADKEVKNIEIFYPSKGELVSYAARPDENDRYFFVDSSVPLPMGTRSLRITGTDTEEKTILFSLEPAANFLGTVR